MRATHTCGALCLAVVVGMAVGCGGRGATKLQGSGASFPAPLYLKWFKDYSAKHSKVQINYQSVGSGQGVSAFIDGNTDFAASDAAMSAEEIKKVEAGVQLLPMTAGSIVLAYNLKDVKDLKLSREAYTGIFLGKVTKWNDPLIQKANEGVDLPDEKIHVVTRSDSSGTTFVFSKHLSAISEDFKTKVGTNKKPEWPVGTGAKGNEGVTSQIKTTPGAIGYVEFGYAEQQKLAMAKLENKAKEFVGPTMEASQAALAAVEMPDDLVAWVSDPDSKEAYPIVTYTWLCCKKQYKDKDKAAALKDLIKYCLEEGQKSSEKLGYIPLPANVVKKVTAALDNIK